MKKGGPEFVKRAPEGLSLFKITPPKASSFFAPRGAMCAQFISRTYLGQFGLVIVVMECGESISVTKGTSETNIG